MPRDNTVRDRGSGVGSKKYRAGRKVRLGKAGPAGSSTNSNNRSTRDTHPERRLISRRSKQGPCFEDIAPFVGRKRLCDVQPEHLLAVVRDLEQKAEVRRSETGKRNPNFIPTRFKPLGSMMRDAYEWGRIDLDPTTRVKLPVCEPVRPDEEEADEASKILLPDELARLDTTASDEEDTRLRLEGEVLLDLGSKQGLRVGEMRGTRWPDFDFERDRHYVRRQIERGTNAVKEPKMRSKRVLPLSPRVAAALQELRAWQVANGHDPMGYVFPGREPGTPRSYSALRDRLERLQR